ncbi:MAG: RNA polymerase factor sigma-54 [Bacteroidota bacterium]
MIHQRLEQKQLQKLSPQQILLMKLLQVPAVSLEQRIKQEIEENPALDDETDDELDVPNQDIETSESQEEKDDFDEKQENEFDFTDYFDSEDYDIPDYKLNINNHSPDEERKERPMVSGSSSHETLIDQLGMLTNSDNEMAIAVQLIGNLEDYGYLTRELDAIVDDLAFNLNIHVTIQEVERVLEEVIHQLDPAGIGARNLQECLLIQLKRNESLNTKSIQLARKVIEKYFNEFSKKHYEKIIAAIGCSEEEFKSALSEILKLNPKPGGVSTENQGNNYIIPDFYISTANEKLELTLHQRNSPELRINNTYKQMYEQFGQASEKPSRSKQEAAQFVRQKIDSAKWFIEAIEQRKNTLQKTMETIMKFQEEYFLTGNDQRLKPMILKDIAEIINMDISTVSRVVNSKYVQTPFGTFLLKAFFSESLSTDSGEEVSSKEVKKILTDCIDAEDKHKPITDDELSKILNGRGYHIARRTIAKYREQLGIPVARMRKEL